MSFPVILAAPPDWSLRTWYIPLCCPQRYSAYLLYWYKSTNTNAECIWAPCEYDYTLQYADKYYYSMFTYCNMCHHTVFTSSAQYLQPNDIPTSAYVSMRQHASACVSMRQHTSAYVSKRHTCSRTISTPRPICPSQRRSGIGITGCLIIVTGLSTCTARIPEQGKKRGKK